MRKKIGEDVFEFISHSKNYISGTFLSKGLEFFSIPILTRLLTPNEYGILSVFTTIISIFSIIMILNIHGCVTRYYYENKSDYDEFIGSNIIFILTFNLLCLIIVYFFKNKLAFFFGIDSKVLFFAVIISSLMGPFSIFLSHIQASKQSNIYFNLTFSRNTLILISTIVLTLVIKENKYLGKIYANLAISALYMIYIMFQILKISNFNYKVKYIKYSLSYGIPLIPHSLSGLILATFDQIIINQLNGPTNTGLYSFAYQIGMVMNVIVLGMNKSWVPFFYENMQEKKYKIIENLAEKYSNYIYCAASGLILFSKEIVVMFADERYHNVLNIIPIIVLGYVFVFLYTIYANYSFFRKKTGLISINTLIASLVNIILNYILIPIYGYMIAAVTTLVSYTLLFILHYINVTCIIKETVIIPVKKVFKNIIIVLLSIIIFNLVLYFHINNILALIIKIMFILLVAWALFIRNKIVLK